MARFGAVEQCSDRDAQNGRNLNQPPGSDPVGADLVFLDLLERDAEPGGELRLRHAFGRAPDADVAPTATSMKFGLLLEIGLRTCNVV
jgi:hypothetical protein